MTHSPSTEQSAIRDALTGSIANLMINAAAGSGKTTTGVWLTEALPATARILFLAFNKNIATALTERCHPRVTVSTFHSLGLAALSHSLAKRPKVDAAKCRWLFQDEIIGEMNGDKKKFFAYVDGVVKLCDLAKSVGVGTLLPIHIDVFTNLISDFGLSFDCDEHQLIRYAMNTLVESNADLTRIDFSDMLYLPLLRDATWDQYDYIFIDEAQDTNSVQREILGRMLTNSASEGCVANGCVAVPRLIAIGDPNQSIYGFRGADANAMPALRSRFAMTELPLAVSYRCSRAVVAEAQRVLAKTL